MPEVYPLASLYLVGYSCGTGSGEPSGKSMRRRLLHWVLDANSLNHRLVGKERGARRPGSAGAFHATTATCGPVFIPGPQLLPEIPNQAVTGLTFDQNLIEQQPEAAHDRWVFH